MKEQYVMEEIKTMFKASRKLYQAFHDIKRLTRKYLLKVTKIKAKKKIAAAEIEEKKKRDEIQAKKRQKMKQRKQKQKQNKVRQQEQKNIQGEEGRNRMIDQKEEKKPQQRSIFSIIKSKQKETQQKQISSKPSLKNVKSARQKAQKEEPKKKSSKQKEKGKSKSKVAQEPKTSAKILQKPTQPQSPYFRFLRMKKNEIRSSVGNISMDKISKIMKTVWDKMKDQEKKQYVLPYEIQYRLYEKQMDQYYRANKNADNSSKKQNEGRKQDQVISDYDFIDELDKM